MFKFFGSTVKIAIWQRRDGMGVIHAHVDDNKKRIAKASGFFKGYTWAMEKNNTGRFFDAISYCSFEMGAFAGVEKLLHRQELCRNTKYSLIFVYPMQVGARL